MHMFFSRFTELREGVSICTVQKPLPASCLIEATSYSQKEKCTEVIVLIPCLKALEAWPICSLTWSTHLRPGSQGTSFKLYSISISLFFESFSLVIELGTRRERERVCVFSVTKMLLLFDGEPIRVDV